jgi:hypothetical protein
MTERFGEDASGLLIAGPVRPGEKGALLSGYIGPSMNPTLFEGDVLEVTPLKNGRVRLVMSFSSAIRPGRGISSTGPRRSRPRAY